MTSKKIIGLDISTSCTGVCCVDESGKILVIEPIVLTSYKTFVEKCENVKIHLEKIAKSYKVDEIYIEQNLSSFRRGLSSAHTINTLARFNGAISLVSYQVFDVEPVLLNVTNARNFIGLKINHKDKTETTKEKVFKWVRSQAQVDWPTKKTGDFKEICYDMADAYVMAQAGRSGCKE